MPLAAAWSLVHRTNNWPGSKAGCSTIDVTGAGLNDGAENVGAGPVVGTCEIAGTTGLVEAAGSAGTAGTGGAAFTGGAACTGGAAGAAGAAGAGTVTTGRAPAGLGRLSEGRVTGAVFVDPAGVDADGASAGVVLPLLSGATGAVDALSGALVGVAVVAVTAAARFANNASVAAPSRSGMRAGADRWRRISVAPTPPPRRRYAAVTP